MPQIRRPRRGSMAFYPRKRASRIYPSLSVFPESDKPKAMLFAGYKAGMTHTIMTDPVKGSPTFGHEIQVPVTILECPPMKVIGVRAYKDTSKGMTVLTEAIAKDLPKDIDRKIITGKFKTDEKVAEIEKAADDVADVRLIVATSPAQTAIGKRKPEVFEVEVGGKTAKERIEFAKGMIGKEIKAEDVFQEGEAVDTTAITTGKGVQGPVKRFGVAIQNRHAKQKLRHVGAIGGQIPGKLRFTVRHAGQMGFQKRTEINKRVIKMGEAKDIVPKSGMKSYGVMKSNFVLLQGSVPGPKKRLIFVRPAVRPPKVKVLTPDVKEIVR